MKDMWQEISGQSLKDYLWPDVNTRMGRLTGIYEGAFVSLALAIFYSLQILFIYTNELPMPEIYAEFIDESLYTQLQLLLNLTCVATALYYIHSIGQKENKTSIFFLLIWVFLEAYSEYAKGFTFLLMLHLLFLIGAINCSRAHRSSNKVSN
jgi:hypothetical protein